MTLSISSSAFDDGGKIPARYTGDGDDVSPPLTFAGVPADTAELAVLVEDPDAPSGTFEHWAAWGIDPDDGGLAEGQQPPSTGTNGFKRRGYGGPQPPAGQEHRYVFTVLALAQPLTLPPTATAKDVRASAQGMVLGEATLTGRYARV